MTGKEQGFLLLTGALGNPERKPLTVAQFRTLANRARQMERPVGSRQLQAEDLLHLGYDRQMSQRIVALLQDEALLIRYLERGARQDCYPISRVNEAYPLSVHKRLGLDAPGCLWAKGDLRLLSNQTVSLVGSRDIAAPNRAFAQRAGFEAARQGITLVSGNARGADRAAQQACLDAGGSVICVVADQLQKYPLQKNVLYLSEDSFDLPFTGPRALSRNRVIHTLGYVTIVAQSDMGMGGTWDGTVKNLRNGWSPVFCFDDGSEAFRELEQLGATSVTLEQLSSLTDLQTNADRFL